MSELHGPYLELKSERVQRELAQLSEWGEVDGEVEGTFRFLDGSQALTFLRRLSVLLDSHPVTPRRLALEGAVLSIAFGEDSGAQVNVGDLELARRISQLNESLTAALNKEDRELWMD